MTPLHKRKLFSVDNPKAIKSQLFGYLNGIHYLAPADMAGRNVCADATEGCKAGCLFFSGNGMYPQTVQSRIDKTHEFFNDPRRYRAVLNLQINQLKLEASYHSLQLCIRMNGTSDLDWRAIYREHPEVQFVEYTKSISRIKKWVRAQKRGELKNVHMTFSRSESNWDECLEALSLGVNVAVVFAKRLPETFEGFRVVDGNAHDLRHLDEKGGVIVGLTAKGKAKKDQSGFVVRDYQ